MIFLAMKNIMSDEAISYLEKPDIDRCSCLEDSTRVRLSFHTILTLFIISYPNSYKTDPLPQLSYPDYAPELQNDR